MQNDHLKTILTDLAEQAAPARQIDLWPALQDQLTSGQWASQQGNQSMPVPLARKMFLRRAALALLAIAVAFAILLATPQGRAIAQDLLKYFTTSSQKSLPLGPTPAAVPTYLLATQMVTVQPTPLAVQGCAPVISPISSTFLCQLKDAQTKLGFPVESFPAQYVDAAFHALEYNPQSKTIRLSFRNAQATYTLEQRLGDFPAEQIGYAIYQAAIQLTRVGKYPAEYAAGAFIFSDDKSMTWNSAEPVYHLRWKEGEQSYSFTLSLSQKAGLTLVGVKEKMILIAENLVTLDQGSQQLTAAKQPSLRDNAGFAIQEPGLLPKKFHPVPDGAWNVLIPNKVTMRYDDTENGQVVGSVEFSQIPIPLDEKNLRWEFSQLYHGQPGEKDFIADEAVRINGLPGQYLVPGGELPPQALYWRDAEREYILIYHAMPDFGGRLSKEDLIAIAESVK